MPLTPELVEQLKEVPARKAALAYMESVASTRIKVADVYDDDAELREALSTLMPDYEYPDISHYTLAEMYRRLRKMPDPAIVAAKEASLKG